MLWAKWTGLILIVVCAIIKAVDATQGRKAKAPESPGLAIAGGLFYLVFGVGFSLLQGALDKIVGWPN